MQSHPVLQARYYDGRSAVAHEVRLKVASYGIDILSEDGKLLARWPRRGLVLGDGFTENGGLALTHETSPDARLLIVTRDAAGPLKRMLPDIVARRRRHSRGIVLRYAAVTAALLGLGALVVDRLPEIAAPLVPHEAKRSLGIAVGEWIFPDEKRCISPGGLEPLRALGERLRLAARIQHPLEITIVDTPMVNAFAAPGGVVMLTSGLIEKARDPDQVAGVLAHEIGHVEHDHATVGVLRSMGLTAMLQLLTGGSGMEMLASAGGTLAALSYSRAAEEEADAAGVAMLEASGVNADGLSRFFEALQKDMSDDGGLFPSWLGTHPPTEARREATERASAGSPALSSPDWQELREVCAISE